MGLSRKAAFTALACAVLLAWIGDRFTIVSVGQHLICGGRLVRLAEPPADVLFVGNSRTARAIDPIFIARGIADRTGRPVRVERLTPIAVMLMRYNALLRDYVRSRGAPRIVVLQLSYTPGGQPGPAAVRTFGRLPFNASPAAISQTIASQLAPKTGGGIATTFHRDATTALRIRLARIAAHIYGVFRLPIRLWRGDTSDCRGEMVRMQKTADVWPYGSLRADTGPSPKTPQQLARREQDAARHAATLPEDPALAEHAFETRQTAETVAMLQAAGSRVLLTTVPRYKETRLPPDLVARYRRAFGTEFINPYDRISPEGQALIQQDMLDGVHTHPGGARVVSTMWIDILSGMTGG